MYVQKIKEKVLKKGYEKRIGSAAIVCCFVLWMCLYAVHADKTGNAGKVDDAYQIGETDTAGETDAAGDTGNTGNTAQAGGFNMAAATQDNELDDAEVTAAQAGIDTRVSEDNQGDSETNDDEESEYANLAIADVTNYVNVRSEPNTDSEIVGKIYDGAVAQILETAGEQSDWFQVVSGNVEGYIKSEFFIYGEEASEVIDQYVTRYASVQADRLNVRQEPSTDAQRIGYLDHGEKVKLLENQGEWLKVEYADGKDGYVAAEYTTIAEEFVYAKTIEEEAAELAAAQALMERTRQQEADAPEVLTKIEFPATTYSSNAELRQAVVDYGLQFLGNRYIHGGSSLVTGTDCSGFTCFIYRDFGYSISRTPTGQLQSAGRSIDYSQIQPGDIICYSSNGGKSCTHVGLYIGNGQIVHEANSRKGVIISAADYSPIVGIKSVID